MSNSAPETIWACAENTASITAWWQQKPKENEMLFEGDWVIVGQYTRTDLHTAALAKARDDAIEGAGVKLLNDATTLRTLGQSETVCQTYEACAKLVFALKGKTDE